MFSRKISYQIVVSVFINLTGAYSFLFITGTGNDIRSQTDEFFLEKKEHNCVNRDSENSLHKVSLKIEECFQDQKNIKAELM